MKHKKLNAAEWTMRPYSNMYNRRGRDFSYAILQQTVGPAGKEEEHVDQYTVRVLIWLSVKQMAWDR